MLGWFFFSAILSTYNKYVFGDGHMHFPCPLFLTSIHFSIQWAFSHIACACFPQALGAERIDMMSWKEWASISVPCGLVTALDVGLSNLALVTISLTFYTMVKSSTPVFVLGWAYLFNIERISWPLIGVIVVIASGEFLTVYGEVYFVLHGFLLCLIASILSGARWTLVQLKLQQLDPPLKSTIVTMKLLAPSMFWSMLLISLAVERPWTKLMDADDNFKDLATIFLLGLLGGTFAVFMILCEFYLILKASAVILMIGGVIKELTTIVIGVFFFGDRLNATNTTGVCVVFSGVILYKVVFHLEKRVKEQQSMEAIPVEDDDDDIDFMEDELVTKQKLSRDDRYKDHVSDDEEDGFSDEADGTSVMGQSVEMVENASSVLHLRPVGSTTSSYDGDSVDHRII
ncbi:triose-phosphate transporter family protein [Nitzschia inconspicua]|uniref:Triose-phosphate transporter family protein n=1 Tax=Nitzschia inconspicua TaxID=303405 RepID=A0A9K3LR19_9STRA|nr:triose-phosphate transporter family protein [Nitzschia inconspicua]